MDKPEFKDMQIVGAGMGGDILGAGVAVGMRKADAELKKMFDEAINARDQGRHDREAHLEVVQDQDDPAGVSSLSPLSGRGLEPGPSRREGR